MTGEREWFDENAVIGNRSAEEIRSYLTEVEGVESADLGVEGVAGKLRSTSQSQSMLQRLFGRRPWQHTGHVFGYVAPGQGRADHAIVPAGEIPPDPGLRGAPITITLDALRVADYPGRGTHRVLFDFYAEHQPDGAPSEDLHFNFTFRIEEGSQAAVLGYPLFRALRSGTDGVRFKCFTVNISNDEDDQALAFLESDVFRKGLQLASAAQPAIAPLSQLALGLTKSVLARRRNVGVQDFFLGLDFSSVVTRARFAEGSFIAVQVPPDMIATWDWNEWIVSGKNSQIVDRATMSRLIPLNYIVIGVSRSG